MSAYCFFDILKVVDSDKMEAYRDRVFDNVAKHGGRYLIVGGDFKVVEGEMNLTFPVLIEFPTLEQAYEWYNAEDYAELKALRFAASEANAVFVQGM